MTEHKDRKSIKGFIAVLQIMAKYLGEDKKYFMLAEHDIIYSSLSTEDCPEDSEDGKMLVELGWFVDPCCDNCWSYFT